MTDWLLEGSLGMHPPLLQRSVAKCPKSRRMKIPEPECSSIEVVDLDGDFDSYHLRGWIRSPHATIPVAVKMRDPIVLFSCFDELFLHIFASRNGTTRLFIARAVCCQSWSLGAIEAREVCLDDGCKFESIHVKCKIKNLRCANAYHYNVSPSAAQEQVFAVDFMGTRRRVARYTCVLCFVRFANIGTLVDHISIFHGRHSCSRSGDVLSIAENPADETAIQLVEIPSKRIRCSEEGPAAQREGVSMLRSRGGHAVDYRLRNYKMLIEQ